MSNELISGDASKLVNDLSYIPSIIGAMGENIAEAQQKLNADYVRTLGLVTAVLGRMAQAEWSEEAKSAYIEKAKEEAVEGLTDEEEKKAASQKAEEQAKAFLDSSEDAKKESISMMLKSFAPSLYHFTESTLEFRADFSQTSNTAINAGLGGGLYGFTLSAGMATAFGYDYQAAGRITSVLSAVRADQELQNNMMNRAKEVRTSGVELPAAKAMDEAFLAQAAKTFETMTGLKVEVSDSEPEAE